jgi:uncharacterized protein
MNMSKLSLEWVPGTFAVVQLPANGSLPQWVLEAKGFLSITRTERELTIVCQNEFVPADAKAERDWVALCLTEPVKFNEIGILAELTRSIADAEVSIFAISTYSNDILLTKSADTIATRQALGQVCDISRL